MRCIIKILLLMVIPVSVYAYQGDMYTVPDTWSKHITPSGVKASTLGLDFGKNGILKMGLTTRAGFRFYNNETDASVYQYLRAKYSGIEMGEGSVTFNLNMRAAVNNYPRPNFRENWVFYNDGLHLSMDGADVDYRLYQGSVELNKVIPLTDITAGRFYLPTFTGYKIDGAYANVSPADFINIGLFYGAPVSYYTYLNTQAFGAILDFPIAASGTQIKGEASYFMHNTDGDYNTFAAKLRIDQAVPTSNIYVQGDYVGNAFIYEVGVDGNVDASKTGFSAYVTGQAGMNGEKVNPYLALYEDSMGDTTEYVMAGFQVSQGITDYVMLSVGLEGRANFTESYGERNYIRAFASVDLIGLIHHNNFLQIIADYYNIDKKDNLQASNKLFLGFRMTQKVAQSFEFWAGANVMNYQYKNSPIKITDTFFKEELSKRSETENTTLAYIGGMWTPKDWCALQLDYTFQYSNLLTSRGKGDTTSTVELWVNFLW